jgi:hypothetical protein
MIHLLYWRNMHCYKLVSDHGNTISAWHSLELLVDYAHHRIELPRTHYEAPHIQRLITDERFDVLSGTTLTEILKEHFPELFI